MEEEGLSGKALYVTPNWCKPNLYYANGPHLDFKRYNGLFGADLPAHKKGCGLGIIPEKVVQLHALSEVPVEDSPEFADKRCLIYRPEFSKGPMKGTSYKEFKEWKTDEIKGRKIPFSELIREFLTI